MAEKSFKSKFDFTDIDTRNIDPDRLYMGTGQQDCMLIAQTFERGAHSIPSESAVFATLSRGIQNNKQFLSSASNSLKGYLTSPQNSAKSTSAQASNFASDSAPEVGGVQGTSSQSDHIMQALNIGTQKQSANTDSFGEKLMNWAKDCIPCDLRLMAFLELHPNVDLLGVFEDYLKNALTHLNGITGLLNNFSSYSDFCSLLNLLSFMCIPDLQRILALLMSLFMLEVPRLDGLIGMLQGLVAPIFAPLLMSITSLLDQFTVLVTGPLDCVVDAINAQLDKLTLETRTQSFKVESAVTPDLTQFSTGLKQLNAQIQEGILQINNKMNFYVDQVKAMLDELGGGDAAYLQAKLKTLQLVRMLSFVSAIILALSKGHSACSSSKTPERQELDSFFDNFLNPQGAFNLWVDSDGLVHIDEKQDDFAAIVYPPNQEEPLSQIGNVFQFEGKDLLDPDIENQINNISTQLSQPINVTAPCKLEIDSKDVLKVNQWMAELNKTS